MKCFDTSPSRLVRGLDASDRLFTLSPPPLYLHGLTRHSLPRTKIGCPPRSEKSVSLEALQE